MAGSVKNSSSPVSKRRVVRGRKINDVAPEEYGGDLRNWVAKEMISSWK